MSTRRARIKAVTALPPRRKNLDADDKKKRDELKEGFEATIRAEDPIKSDKTSKDNVGHNSSLKDQDLPEIRVSPIKRRLSVDRTQGRRLSVDKNKDGVTKTPRSRRLSIDKATRHKTPIRCVPAVDAPKEISAEEIACLIIDKTVQEATLCNIPPVPAQTEESFKAEKESWFSSNKILKGLLDANKKQPQNSHQSINKESDAVSQDLPKPAPFFVSPVGRASPRRPPIVRTPVIEVDLTAEKFIAPHKGPNSVDSEKNFIDTHATDVRHSDPEEVIVEKIVDKNEWLKLQKAQSHDKSMDSDKALDDYVIKSPETSTVMDGIVPLKPVSKIPKPLDLLKNEIISENAEVLFDPIVPLPSPSKVRPKLKPVPRLGPRRNSFQQGSASESEDENRRLHGRPGTPATPVHARQRHDSHTSHATAAVPRDVARVRNDSVCSTVSQGPTHAVGSPLREREKMSKTRREEMAARRNVAMARRQKSVERDKLTMYDLIFYNPKTNPIIPDQDEIKAKAASKKEEEDRKAEDGNEVDRQSTDAAPAVPQIKLGPNGEIILDEQSLVVNQSDQRKIECSTVREGAWGGGASRAYRRTPRCADWCDAETVRFYRALAAIGTDFTLMQPLFPSRNRRDLKLKFKKEERMNLAQIEMALRSGAKWDPERLETEFAEERKAQEEAEKKAKERLLQEKEEAKKRKREIKSLRLKMSRCSKTMGDSAIPAKPDNKTPPGSLDDYVKLQQQRKLSMQKKKNPDDFILPKPPKTTEKRAIPPDYATLTLINKQKGTQSKPLLLSHTSPHPLPTEMATITRGCLPTVPPNIETGSLVVLTVNDPQSPSRKMLQTYIAQGPGNLTPVSLPANFLNSVVGFMKKPNSVKLASPAGSKTPVLSPRNRKRKSSYTITQL